MRLFVVGASGFIGSHVAQYLEESGHKVFRVTRDLQVRCGQSEVTPIEVALQSVSPFALINCAGSGSVAASWSEPLMDFDANVKLVVQILEGLRKYSPLTRFVHVSSAAVYGQPEQLPVGESHPVNPLSPYGWHKLISERVVAEYVKLHRIEAAACRVFSAYGPGQRKLLLWDLMRQIMSAERPRLRGTGDEARDFVYISDLAAAIESIALRAECRGEAINVASGSRTSIRDIATTLLRVAGRKDSIEFDGTSMPGYPDRWHADVRSLVSLGWHPQIGLEDGLSATWAWFQQLCCRE